MLKLPDFQRGGKSTTPNDRTKVWTRTKIPALDAIVLPKGVQAKIDRASGSKAGTQLKRSNYGGPGGGRGRAARPLQRQSDVFSVRDRTSSYPTRPSYIAPVVETLEERSMRERRDGLRDLNPSVAKADSEARRERRRRSQMGIRRRGFDESVTKLRHDRFRRSRHTTTPMIL